MEKLFEDFNQINLKEWVEKISTDLKGKPLDVLTTKPEMDLDIKAFHHQDEISETTSVFTKTENKWSIRKSYSTESNDEILADLNEGVDAIGLQMIDPKQTKDILFEHLVSDIEFKTTKEAMDTEVDLHTHLNFDIFTKGIENGKWMNDTSDFISFFKTREKYKSIWISGSIYGETGSTSIQELAFTAVHLNEYIQLLVDNGYKLATINDKVCIELSVTDNYFVNIAKVRIIRSLVRGIFEAYDPSHEHKAITIYAKTSCRYLALNDANNNLLRATTQAMSAIIGGCDVLTVQPIRTANEEQNILNNRMTKNIQLILKEESYLDKVVDPSEGSYYLESISDQLLTKSWELFKSIEKMGGLRAAIESNHIQDLIETNKKYLIDQLNNNEKTFLGVNKYPSTLEDWKEVKKEETIEKSVFKALKAFRIEAYYNKTVTA